MSITDNIKALAKQKGMSLAYIEKEAGLGAGCISHWHRVSPTTANLMEVAKVLETDLNTLTKKGVDDES